MEFALPVRHQVRPRDVVDWELVRSAVTIDLHATILGRPDCPRESCAAPPPRPRAEYARSHPRTAQNPALAAGADQARASSLPAGTRVGMLSATSSAADTSRLTRSQSSMRDGPAGRRPPALSMRGAEPTPSLRDRTGPRPDRSPASRTWGSASSTSLERPFACVWGVWGFRQKKRAGTRPTLPEKEATQFLLRPRLITWRSVTRKLRTCA